MDSQRYPCNLELNNNVEDIFAFPGLKVLCSDTARLVRQSLVGYRCELHFWMEGHLKLSCQSLFYRFKSKENRKYIRVEFRQSHGMYFCQPLQMFTNCM